MERLTPEQLELYCQYSKNVANPAWASVGCLVREIDALQKELGEARQAAIEIAHRKAQSEIDLRAELHAWENYWGPEVREKTSAEIASLRAQVDVLSDALKQYADPQNWNCPRCGKRDSLNCFMGRWRGSGEHGYDIATAALSNSAIAERLKEEEGLRRVIAEFIDAVNPQAPYSFESRLKAAASRMWPSGKGDRT